MGNSCVAVLKTICSHILYLKNDTKELLKAPNESSHEKYTLPHERLQEAIEEKITKTFNRSVPLDTRQNPIVVYGKDYTDHEEALKNFLFTLQKGHTLVKSEVLPLRRTYATGSFFVSKDGYYADPQTPCLTVLGICEQFAKQVAILSCSLKKTPTVIHNLKMSEIIISDMLGFVESLQVEPVVSTHQERYSRRRSGRDLANHT